MTEQAVIQDLFEFCLTAFRSVISNRKVLSAASEDDSEDDAERYAVEAAWKEQKDRLVLWGDGFDIYDGELDRILSNAESEHLKKSVVMLLGTIAGSLVRLLEPGVHKAQIELFAQLSNVVKEIAPEAEGIFFDDSDSDFSDSEDEISIVFEGLSETNDALFDLVPFIEEIYSENEESDSEEEDKEESTVEVSPSLESQFYTRNIMDKFPNIDKILAENLAQLNWLRFQRVRLIAEERVEYERSNVSYVQNISKIPKIPHGTVTTFVDSAYYSLPPIILSSGASVVSESSIATSKPEMSGNAKIPKPPVDLFSEEAKAFTCNICFKTVYNIDNRQKWKKHVFRDLQPYSMRFDVKDDFVKHILDDHLKGSSALSYTDVKEIVAKCEVRQQLGSLERHNCPFCEEIITGKKRIIQRHIGRHLEEVALKALPAQEEGSDSESEDGRSDVASVDASVESVQINRDPNGDDPEGPQIPTTTHEREATEKAIEIGLGEHYERGLSFYDMERYDEALECFQRALTSQEEVRGKEHPSTLDIANFIARALGKLERFEEALEMYQRVAIGREKGLGIHSSTIDTMLDIGETFLHLRQGDNAQEWHQRALDKCEIALGKENTKTLEISYKTAVLLAHRDKLDEALELLHRTKTGQEKVLGTRHPSSIETVDFIGKVLLSQEREQEALDWCQPALAEREETLGIQHKATVALFDFIGKILLQRKLEHEAIEWYHSALDKREKTLGKEHPSTVDIAHKTAVALVHLDRLDEGLKLLHETLSGEERVLGDGHPSTLETVDLIGKVLLSQGRGQDAIEWYQGALAKREKTLGIQHPSTSDTITIIASILSDEKRHDEVLEFLQQTLVRAEKSLGEEHPSTLEIVHKIGCLLGELGRYEEALEWVRRGLAGREKVLGEEHPSTLKSLGALGGLFGEQGKKAELAELEVEYERRALAAQAKRKASSA